MGVQRVLFRSPELAARIAGPRRPPFASVNDIMLAVAPNGRTNVGSVGRCDVGFRHEASRADLAVHQRSEPAVLVRPCPVTMENFHVPGVRSYERRVGNECVSTCRFWATPAT